jgi:hypothetical protein
MPELTISHLDAIDGEPRVLDLTEGLSWKATGQSLHGAALTGTGNSRSIG